MSKEIMVHTTLHSKVTVELTKAGADFINSIIVYRFNEQSNIYLYGVGLVVYSYFMCLLFCGLNLPLESSQEAQDAIAVIMKDYNYPLNPANCARVGWRAARLYIKQ